MAAAPASVTTTANGGRIKLRVPKAPYKVTVTSKGGDKNEDGTITLRDS